MKWEGIIFDLDGVLCFTDEYHYQAWKSVADSLGIPFDRTVNDRLRGISRMASLEIILEKSRQSFSESEKMLLAEQKNERYKALLENMTPADLDPRTKSTLDALRKRGYALAIGSSSKNTPLILRRIGLENYFDAVSDGNNITRSKPAPDVFLCAAQMLGLAPESCLVVEDAVSGAQAAHAAGMQAACLGAASRDYAGDYNMASVEDLLTIAK